MNLHLSELGGRQWVVLLLAVGLLFLVAAFLCAGIGLVAANIKGTARLVALPFFLAVVIVLLPGFLLAAMLFGFMRPDYAGHLLPPEKQSWQQRGINGLIALIGGQPAPAEPANPS